MTDTPAPAELPQGDALGAEQLEAAKRDWRFLRLLAAMSLVMGAAGAFTLNLVDPDLWGHVAYGREAIADGKLHRTATHTFTAEGYRWVNHENLAELAMATGFDTLGVRGMLVAKMSLGMLILTVMFLVARSQGVRVLTAWTLLLLVASNLKAFFVMRARSCSASPAAPACWCCCTWRFGSGDRATHRTAPPAASIGDGCSACRC